MLAAAARGLLALQVHAHDVPEQARKRPAGGNRLDFIWTEVRSVGAQLLAGRDH